MRLRNLFLPEGNKRMSLQAYASAKAAPDSQPRHVTRLSVLSVFSYVPFPTIL